MDLGSLDSCLLLQVFNLELFVGDKFFHLIEFVFTLSDTSLEELSLLVQLLDILLQACVRFLQRVEVFLEVDCHLPLLKDFKCADIDFFHEAELLFLVCDQLVIHIHEDPGIGEELSVEDTLPVQKIPEEDQFLLSLEFELDDFFLVVLVFTRHLGACSRLDVQFELLDLTCDLRQFDVDLVVLCFLLLHVLEERS